MVTDSAINTKDAKNAVPKIAVLGAGAWGTALAMNLSQRHRVSLWARNAGHVSGMRKARSNPLYLGDFKFNDQLSVEDDLQTALDGADLILSVVPTAGFRGILKPCLLSGHIRGWSLSLLNYPMKWHSRN
jgi:glycerol-3-phosphate dehydrogenase